MTARHGAGHHSGLVMLAIHLICGCGGRFLVMMPRNRALTGRAAGGLIPRPCGTGERRVEQDNHEQTDACGNRTAAMLIAEGHVRPNGHSMIRQKAFACSSWLNGLQFRHMGWQKRTGDLAGRAKGLISEKLIRGGREGRGPDLTSHEGERFARQKKSVALPGARQIFESALLNTQ